MSSNINAGVTPATERFSSLLSERFGLNRPLADLENQLIQLAEGADENTLSSYVDKLKSANHETWQLVLRKITIPESYFFRNRAHLDALASHVIPEMSAQKKEKPLRIWSMAAARGEEAYSIAMVCQNMQKNGLLNLMPSIYATDITEEYLANAHEGKYRHSALRACTRDERELYFRAEPDGTFFLKDKYRDNVHFEALNLASKLDFISFVNRYGPFDIIFCRNVLIYFTAQTIQRLLQLVDESLEPNGYVFFGSAEFPSMWIDDFQPIAIDATWAWQRKSVTEEKKSQQSVTSSDFQKKDKPNLENYQFAKGDQELNSELLQILKFIRQGELKDTLERAKSLVETNPLVPEAHYALAICLELVDQSENAVRSLTQATFLDDSFSLAHLKLALLLNSQGHSDTARRRIDWAKQSLTEDDSSRTELLTGMNEEQFRQTIEQVEQWLS